jgi:hypothetical protein
MSRGVLYIAWGDKAEKPLARSIASLKQWHPELEYRVARADGSRGLLHKDAMYDLSPFDSTLYLDADTVVMGRLDFGFRTLDLHGLVCCICENPWLKRYHGHDDSIEYNTGVLFFDRTTKDAFEEWKTLSPLTPGLIHDRGVMPNNDQWGFSVMANRRYRQPFILPMNWNLRPIWQTAAFGPIKIWHDYSDPSPGLVAWNEEQSKPGAVIRYARFR